MTMLKIDFINVGDGDAALIRETRPGAEDYVMLMDCGRPHIEFAKGSLRRPALNYLMEAGIDHIDLMLLSHLHFDHIGGALAVLRHFPVKRLRALYLPPPDAGWITPPALVEKTVVGLCDALNMFRDIVAAAHTVGCLCEEANVGCETLTEKLALRLFLPDAALCARQRRVFDALYLGETPPEAEIYTVSKERNCSSLIARLGYAGRAALLTGDAYAAYWEGNGLPPCDILKLPHHGDALSLTPGLLGSLAPKYAIVSCQNDANAKKERPAAFVMEMLQKSVPRILCTENRELPAFPAATRRAVRFTIDEAGVIACYDADGQA